MSADLAEFLLARYDEIEAKAADIHEATCYSSWWGHNRVGYDARECNCGEPERGRADIAAKRAIVELHRHEGKGPGPVLATAERESNEGVFGCVICSCVDDDPGRHLTDGWCVTLRLLAQPFAGHPEHRDEWRPVD